MEVYYVHANYDGTFSLDEKITGDLREVFGDYYQIEALPHDITYVELLEIAKKYKCRKLVLDL